MTLVDKRAQELRLPRRGCEAFVMLASARYSSAKHYLAVCRESPWHVLWAFLPATFFMALAVWHATRAWQSLSERHRLFTRELDVIGNIFAATFKNQLAVEVFKLAIHSSTPGTRAAKTIARLDLIEVLKTSGDQNDLGEQLDFVNLAIATGCLNDEPEQKVRALVEVALWRKRQKFPRLAADFMGKATQIASTHNFPAWTKKIRALRQRHSI